MKKKPQQISGYKVTNENMQCLGYQYELNKKFTHRGEISMCNTGFHYCPVAADCFGYYTFTSTNRVFEIIDHGTPIIKGDKNCTNIIEFVKELTWQEVLTVCNQGKDNTGIKNSGNWNSGDRNTGDRNTGNWNTGDRNTGDSNTGYRNTGDRNTGDSNTGYRNTGDRNSGDSNTGYRNTGDRNTGDSNTGYRNTGDRNSGNWNTGDRNSGDSNTGYRNTGDRNSGNWNTGDRNSGDSNSGYRNTGNWNTGDRNTGDSNTGYRNTGAFCTDNDPLLILFNKPTKMTVREWEQHKAYTTMENYLEINIWVPEYKMTYAEKEQYPSYKTTEGYLKPIPAHEAWNNMWNNLSDNYKQIFIDLPNFDKGIFKEITGIDV